MAVISIPTSFISPSFFKPSQSSRLLSSSSSALFTNDVTSSLLMQTKTNYSTVIVGRTRPRTERTNKGLSCTCLFGLGVPELVVIAGVVALVFGPKKLPEVGKSLGKTVKSFQQAAKEFETEIKKEPDSLGDVSGDKPTETVNKEEKDDAKVSSTKESV